MNLIERILSLRARPRDEGHVACRLCDWSACVPDCPMEEADRGDSAGDTRTSRGPSPEGR
jgi:hypothetical protein